MNSNHLLRWPDHIHVMVYTPRHPGASLTRIWLEYASLMQEEGSFWRQRVSTLKYMTGAQEQNSTIKAFNITAHKDLWAFNGRDVGNNDVPPAWKHTTDTVINRDTPLLSTSDLPAQDALHNHVNWGIRHERYLSHTTKQPFIHSPGSKSESELILTYTIINIK